MKKKPAKKTEVRYKSVMVVQKDRPLQDLICEAANTYLEELIMHYQEAFEGDHYAKALAKTGTMSLHGKFYEMCKRYVDLNGTLQTVRKAQSMTTMAITDVQQIETMFAIIRETNDAKLEHMEQLALVMRPGQAWRKELDAVGLGKNADKWLTYWDKTYPKLQILKQDSAGQHNLEIIMPAD